MKEYNELIELRNRISNDGSGEIYEEDHLLLDRVLDILEEYMQLVQEIDYNNTQEFYKELETYFAKHNKI